MAQSITNLRKGSSFKDNISSLILLARLQGLTPINPVLLQVKGWDETGVITRWVVVSYAPPSTAFERLWLDPNQRKMGFPINNNWVEINSVETMFGTANTVVNGGSGGSGSGGGTMTGSAVIPVQNLTELDAVDTTNLTDKRLAYAEDDKSIWAFDKDSTATLIPGIRQPQTGPGRWYVIQSATGGSVGNIDGGTF